MRQLCLPLAQNQAVVYFDKLIEVEPRNPRGYTGLALAYIGRGNADNAIDTLRDGVKELSDDTSFLNDAVSIFEDIIGDEPSNPDAYIGIAEVYVALGDRDKAIDLLEKGYEATNIEKIGGKIKDLLPVEVTKWFIEPSIEADDIQPVISIFDYPLKAWDSIIENPDYFFNVSEITIGGKVGLIDNSGDIRLPVEFDKVYFNRASESLAVEREQGNNGRWKNLNEDYSLSEGTYDYSEIETFAWNFFDNRLYMFGGNGYETFFGPLSAETPIPVSWTFNYDVTTLPPDNFDKETFHATQQRRWHFNRAYGATFDSNASSWVNLHRRADGQLDGSRPSPVEFSSPWNGGKSGYVTGNKIIAAFDFDRVGPFVEERAPVAKDRALYYLAPDGKIITPDGYDLFDVYNFSEGLAAMSKNGLWGVINKNGEVLIPCQYEAVRPVYHGKAWVKSNGKWGVADLTTYVKFGNMGNTS
ncbi:Tetratricopeptide repeat [Desulfitobacterium hafniense]|uniref:Tetratricopeptide repeat n=1 Tax=Desulfitobacterium hafniense TaxID=49338 RepID=A0A098B7U6_DESHA|nr:WG repeat-containing protein [Desulfitobacterium hafniense]CDX04943.1 Tetratricopeptide repeat [Desulfitobacterium hafniense]